MAALLALLSAAAYGGSDFAGGLASRRASPWLVAAAAQAIEVLLFLAAALTVFGGQIRLAGLAWGALAGVGSGVGVLALYQGLAVAAMTVVAALSAVLTAALPVLFGLLLGNRLSLPAAVGIVIALPAIALVSYQPTADQPAGAASRAGVLFGCLAGVGFALLFIALDRAGTRGGAWPLMPQSVVAVALTLPFILRHRPDAGAVRHATPLILGAGLLGGAGNLLFLAATGHGELATVAVLTSLYPAGTILLARLGLDERWNRVQILGLLAATGSIVLVTV